MHCGATWRSITPGDVAPMQRAASTYDSSLIESTTARITRVESGTRETAMARMTVSRRGPSAGHQQDRQDQAGEREHDVQEPLADHVELAAQVP